MANRKRKRTPPEPKPRRNWNWLDVSQLERVEILQVTDTTGRRFIVDEACEADELLTLEETAARLGVTVPPGGSSERCRYRWADVLAALDAGFTSDRTRPGEADGPAVRRTDRRGGPMGLAAIVRREAVLLPLDDD